MGYHATEKNAVIVGVKCSQPVETKSVIFGCVPPPIVIFKLMQRYNTALIRQSGFPANQDCKVDEKYEKEMKEWEAKEEETFKKKADEDLLKWKEKEKLRNLYNN
jgi:hypothetical protein